MTGPVLGGPPHPAAQPLSAPLRRRRLPPVPRPGQVADPGQRFVATLRAAADDFAAAAGADTAVVREAVPPARHRRARCRIALRGADGAATDVTFLGAAGGPGGAAAVELSRQIARWLHERPHRDGAWTTSDPDSDDGTAIDLPAWIAARA